MVFDSLGRNVSPIAVLELSTTGDTEDTGTNSFVIRF